MPPFSLSGNWQQLLGLLPRWLGRPAIDDGQRPVRAVPACQSAVLGSEDSRVTFTLTFIRTPELAEGAARKGNSFPHAVIHLAHSPPVLWSCICSGPACSSDGSLQEPTLSLVLPSAPVWAAWPGGAEHNLCLLQCGSLHQPILQPHTWSPGARPTPGPPGRLR